MRPQVYSRKQIIEIMKDRNISAVARAAGLHYQTLRDLLAGADSRASTLEKVTAYLLKEDWPPPFADLGATEAEMRRGWISASELREEEVRLDD